jgi:hypothetical protein
MPLTELQAHLKEIGACSEGVRRALEYTPQQAWDVCRSPEWLFWWAGKTEVNDRAGIIVAASAFMGLMREFVERDKWGPELRDMSEWGTVPPDTNISTHNVAMKASNNVVRAIILTDNARRSEFEQRACQVIRPLLKLPFSGAQG